jgi:hypothetical protein
MAKDQGAGEVVLFTDGACSGNPGPGGWAYILRHPGSGRETKDSGAAPVTVVASSNATLGGAATLTSARALALPGVTIGDAADVTSETIVPTATPRSTAPNGGGLTPAATAIRCRRRTGALESSRSCGRLRLKCVLRGISPQIRPSQPY